MNEPSNFCDWPCDHPEAVVNVTQELMGMPPQARSIPLPQHGTTIKPQKRHAELIAPRQDIGTKRGLPGRDLTVPAYQIRNAFGVISNRTAATDLIHQGGWAEYDTHNL